MKPLTTSLLTFIKYMLIGLGIYIFMLGLYVLGMFFMNGTTPGGEYELYSALKMTLWLALWSVICFGLIRTRSMWRYKE